MLEPLTQFDLVLGKELAQLMFVLEVTYAINLLIRMLSAKKTTVFGAVLALVFVGGLNWYLMSFGWYYLAICLGGFCASLVPRSKVEDRDT